MPAAVTAGLAVAWATADQPRLRPLLRLAGFDDRPDGSLAMEGLRVVVVASSGRDRLAWAEPPEAVGAVRSTTDAATDPAAAGLPRLVAVAVATVELERGAAPFGGVREMLPADTLLGGRAAWSGTPGVVVAEPTTEGRLAASLARWGEGPVAIYVAVGWPALETAAVALGRLGERPRRGAGPFGVQLLARTSTASGPNLLLVGEARHEGPRRERAPGLDGRSGGDAALEDAGTREDASATIEP